jgi:hypothetical protein
VAHGEALGTVAGVALPASARDVFAKMKKQVTPELRWGV